VTVLETVVGAPAAFVLVKTVTIVVRDVTEDVVNEPLVVEGAAGTTAAFVPLIPIQLVRESFISAAKTS